MGAVSDMYSMMKLHRGHLLLFLVTTNILNLGQCQETEIDNSLLLGGYYTYFHYSNSMELITSTGVCTPRIPPIPVQRAYAAAVLIHNKILYCGGDTFSDGHHSCHSYQLGGQITHWRDEPRMLYIRSYFSLNLVAHTVFAIGGESLLIDPHDTVESYTEETGWILEEGMVMDKWRSRHCSIVLDQQLIIVGGFYGSRSSSSSVQAIDISNKTGGWRNLESMKTARYHHGCNVWTQEKQTGIVVAGGYGGRGYYLGSVEFYSYTDHRWTQLGSLVTPRVDHSVGAMGGILVVIGGEDKFRTTSVEYFNDTLSEWEVMTYMEVERSRHASVSLP